MDLFLLPFRPPARPFVRAVTVRDLWRRRERKEEERGGGSGGLVSSLPLQSTTSKTNKTVRDGLTAGEGPPSLPLRPHQYPRK